MSDESVEVGVTPARKRWPCGHEESFGVPSFEARSEQTFYGSDEEPPVSTECPICAEKRQVEAKLSSTADALRCADIENNKLVRRVHRLKDELQLRMAADARVDKLIDLVASLVARGPESG